MRTSEQASEWRVEMFEGGKGGQQKITRGVSAETKKSLRCALFFTKMALSGLFFVHFGLFQTNITILEQYHVKKCYPVSNAGIQTHDLLYASLHP